MATDLQTQWDYETRDICARSLSLRASSVDEQTRSFEAVVSSEAPAQVFDMRSWEVIDEVLLSRGGVFPDRVPLLRNHRRNSLDDVVGSATDFVQAGDQWTGRGIVAAPVGENDPVERYWRRIVEGHLRAVSIGYRVLNFVDIPPNKKQSVGGRDYAAGENTLRVTTEWRVHELSLTPIGADDRALIRNQTSGQPPKKRRVYFR